MMDIKYILDYLREERLIEPIAGVTVDLETEYFDAATVPMGCRLVLNGKDTNIVIRYIDYIGGLTKNIININQRQMKTYKLDVLNYISDLGWPDTIDSNMSEELIKDILEGFPDILEEDLDEVLNTVLI